MALSAAWHVVCGHCPQVARINRGTNAEFTTAIGGTNTLIAMNTHGTVPTARKRTALGTTDFVHKATANYPLF